jgi:hypothetical protein
MEHIILQKKFTSYIGKGLVYGIHCNGNEGVYESKEIKVNSWVELINEVSECIDENNLGGNFHKTLGIGLEIHKTETFIINDKPYVNEETTFQILGHKLTDDQREFLMENYHIGHKVII